MTGRPTTAPGVWRRVKAIALEALECPEAERAAYVDRACAGEESIRREVESLVRFAVKAQTHFESPGTSLMLGVLAPDTSTKPSRR